MTESSTDTNQDMFETPGQLLRLQREKIGLSAEDIAKRIHLDIKIIEAIEADNNDDLPSAIYVRGYLRSYAKTVEADADKVIELYNNETPPEPPEIQQGVKPPTQASSTDKPVKAFTYLLILGLVLLLLIWYQSNFVVEVNTEEVNIEKEEEISLNNEAEINDVDINYEVITHDDASWQSPDVAEEESNLNDEAEPPAILETDEENGLLKLQSFNEEQTIEISTVEDIELEPNEETVADTVTVSNGDAIVMQISNDSWIEIMDKDNNKVFFDLAKAGKTYTLQGSAPFEMLFGYAAGVSLTLNGETVDFKSHIKNGIARFTLPE